MIALLRTYLQPYRRQLVIVSALLVVQAIANLYLPTLNADIINNGVVKGDTGYILQVGALMLVVTFLLAVAAIVAVYFSARIAMAFRSRRAEQHLPGRPDFSQAEVNNSGRRPHHSQHERRPAGPDGRPRA
jgi:ATP-binding cassette subfamily B protein